MSYTLALPFHPGELHVQNLLRIPSLPNPTVSTLSPQAAFHLPVAPLLAIGTLDSHNRPWTTIWGGASGLSQAVGRSVIGIKTKVDARWDPVVETLFAGKVDGEVVREDGEGRMVAGLTVDLVTRKRVKIFGRMIAGAVKSVEADGEANGQGEVQLVVRVEQSLSNCPKYLNTKHVQPAPTSAELITDSPNLTLEATDLIANSDLFFISSCNSSFDMDTNHRGGPTGFVRHACTPSNTSQIFWPEYSGNRLYQTLGNLQITPLAGLVFPDFTTGSVLYLTGTTETLVGDAAAAVIARSNVVVKLTITAARLVRNGLPFRGDPGEQSPYNPLMRPLVSETVGKTLQHLEDKPRNTATLLSQTSITPTISRFRFSLSRPATWKPGQWVALDFSSELDIGYSHMRDDDPRSLNDDFVRTFTVSSPPIVQTSPDGGSLGATEFEITIRKVGVVTDFLFKQQARHRLEVPVRGFGGEVEIEQDRDGEELTPVVVGGVGITPLMAQMQNLMVVRLKVFWTVQTGDLRLVVDFIKHWPALGKQMEVYVTGVPTTSAEEMEEMLREIEGLGTQCKFRRLEKEDLEGPGLSNKWHVCVSTTLRKVLLGWLQGKEVVYEDFNF